MPAIPYAILVESDYEMVQKNKNIADAVKHIILPKSINKAKLTCKNEVYHAHQCALVHLSHIC